MVKDHFVSKYALPDYTVSVGSSGGGIQQYIYAQNHPGLLDAIVPQYAYTDQVSQITNGADCCLIERWIDFQLIANPASHWADWEQRTLLEGLNARNNFPNPLVDSGAMPWLSSGNSECGNNWNSLTPLVINPTYGTATGVTPDIQASNHWTFYQDSVNIYGMNEDGYANRSWDNIGVQYGLKALVDGNITPEEFLDLNWNVGSWKQEADFIQEVCPYLPEVCDAVDFSQNSFPDIWPNQIDPWSMRNMNLTTDTTPSPTGTPAPRAAADSGAIESSIEHGIVNRGNIQIPVIDLRHYLEEALDMHNTHQSFAARQRLINFDGDASNQLIWFADLGVNKWLCCR